MSRYFCHECTIASGLVKPAIPDSFTGTNEQLGRHIKHTIPTSIYPVNGIFNDGTYATYSGYIASAIGAGFLEVDDQNRKNLVWYAGKEVGVEVRNGVFTAPANGVKVVLPEDASQLHA